jgi:hypothetical protein
MNMTKADILIQYILAVAGQNDYYQRELGPIHLIKYVYLGDLAYAEQHRGQTYTGIKWRFHKFGPWSEELYQRLEPALNAVNADQKKTSHPKYEDDFIRWLLLDDDLEERLARQLPLIVCLAIKNAVRDFGSDTSSLLHHIYLTRPMLTGAPGEYLDFTPLIGSREPDASEAPKEKPKLDKKDLEFRANQIKALKERIRDRLKEKRKVGKLVRPDPPPRYDKVFQEGLQWLEEIAGKPIEEKEGKAKFSDDVWKSKARFDPDVS